MSTQNVSDRDIVFCPKCNCNLFSPVFVYAYIPGDIPAVINQPKVLSQCLTAFKCAECGQVIPHSQFADFTLEKIQASREVGAKQDDSQEANEVQSASEAN